jgi:hypothetical protein
LDRRRSAVPRQIIIAGATDTWTVTATNPSGGFTLTMPWSSAIYNTGTLTCQGQYFPEPNSPEAQ